MPNMQLKQHLHFTSTDKQFSMFTESHVPDKRRPILIDLDLYIWANVAKISWKLYGTTQPTYSHNLNSKIDQLLTASTSWKLDGHSLLANKQSGFRIINRHSWFKQHCYALKKLNCFRSMLSKRINIVPAIFPSTHFIDSCSNSFNTCPKSKTSNFLVIFQINNIIGTFKINIKP